MLAVVSAINIQQRVKPLFEIKVLNTMAQVDGKQKKLVEVRKMSQALSMTKTRLLIQQA
jgi:hypothetical protein